MRELGELETRCACGASIAWLERAPAMLRDKLGSGVRATIASATVSTLIGCSGACAPPDANTMQVDAASDADAPSDTGADR